MSGLPKYRGLLYKTLFILRLPELARFWNRANTIILCYHGVTERSGLDPADRSRIAVSRALFIKQLKYLKRRYNVIALRDYLAARKSGRFLSRHSVILTFDDGLRNFVTVAAPALKALNLPASVFLVTNELDLRDDSSLGLNWTPIDDRISLSWLEANILRSTQEIDFGSHTCSHPELPELIEDMDSELRGSFAVILKNISDVIPPSLAYPYGNYSELILAKARSVGYSCGLTTESGANSMHTDLFRLRRDVVRRDDTIPIFAARVSGLVGWLRLARDIVRSCGYSWI